MRHEGDKETSNFDVTTKTYSLRQSQWSGWLQDLDSIKMEYTDTTPTEEGDIKGKYELRIASAKDPVTGQTLSPQASVWVGPIATAGTGANVKYTPLTTDDIYEPIDAAKAAEAAAGGEWAEDENDEYITRWVTEKTTGLTLGEDGKTVVSGSGKGTYPIVVSYASSPSFTVSKDKSSSSTSALLDTAFRQVEYAGVLKGAANPEGGKAFVTWMLSKAVQEDIPGQMYMYPVLPDAALPEALTKFGPLSKSPVKAQPQEITPPRAEWLHTRTEAGGP